MNKVYATVIAICFGSLVSCSFYKPTSNTSDADYPSAEYVTQCNEDGGKVVRYKKDRPYSCTKFYSDSGKTCTDATDCKGRCLSTSKSAKKGMTGQTGQCEADNARYGCRQPIKNGVIQGFWCMH